MNSDQNQTPDRSDLLYWPQSFPKVWKGISSQLSFRPHRLLAVDICCRVFVGFVTDFDFSPFDDYLLSTCSQDGTVSTLTCLTINNWSVLWIHLSIRCIDAYCFCFAGAWFV